MHNGEDTEMRDIENFEGGRGEQFDVEAIGNNFSKKMSSKKKRTGCLQLLGFGKNNSGLGNQKWEDLTKEQQKKKIENWWSKVRRYNNKLRLQARLQKMAEQNLREMMIDDIQDDEEDDNTAEDQQTKIKWYLIDSDNTFCKTWDMLITFVTIYNLFVVPIVIVFENIYTKCIPMSESTAIGLELTSINSVKETSLCPSGTFGHVTDTQKNLKSIELAIDIIYLVEILLCFVKRTIARRDLANIIPHYLKTYFFFDVIATVPNIFLGEGREWYFLKLFRFVHVYRIHKPGTLLMKCLLTKYSKKRQNDLIGFMILILWVIYSSHINACIWLYLGSLEDCSESLIQDPKEKCIQSWIFSNSFDNKPITTQYIFAFYWIFEVITTVGYGDFYGKTSYEYVFSIILEFVGLTFFSFLMGTINGIFNTKDNFDDLIEEKLDSLDMWIKKIEKSNKPFHIQPTLYNDIRKYVEQAFMYDFNLVIEEFTFYQHLTPKM